LTVSYNKFTKVPESIGNLINLKVLDLTRLLDLEITEIPEYIRGLVKLERLLIDNTNYIGKIPTWISELNKLQFLIVRNNYLDRNSDHSAIVSSEVNEFLEGITTSIINNQRDITAPVVT
jgi:Leucine-rich repeat (LRR) protein